MNRCEWATSSPLEMKYHDEEWGVPVHDDRVLFEMLILEGAQAGLSWATVLKKRDGYRRAFDHFDAEKIARYDRDKIARLLQDPGIIRNRLKVAAAIENAKRFLAIRDEYGSFDRYIWSFVSGQPINGVRQRQADVPATSPESDRMSKSLKRQGFKFVGSTICYAYMQSVGMVNDHVLSCFRYAEILNLHHEK